MNTHCTAEERQFFGIFTLSLWRKGRPVVISTEGRNLSAWSKRGPDHRKDFSLRSNDKNW
jgi:hypothetical protein